MARRSAYRWQGWRVNESGRSIKSNPKGDDKALSKGKPRKPNKKQRSMRKDLWWWTKAKCDGKCDSCFEPYGEDDTICFRYEPKSILCEICAEAEGVAGEARKSKALTGRPIKQTRLV